MAENGYIRRAAAGDIPALIDIIHRTIESYGYIFELEFELADFLNFDVFYRDGNAELYIIEHDGVIAGCGALKFNSEIPYLSRVYVDEVYRGNGYGKAMVLHLMRRNADLGNAHIELWSDTRFRTAHALYEKLGYVFTGRIRPLGDINNCFEYHYSIDPAHNPYLITEFRSR